MPTLDVTVACPVHDSFRVQQIVGMFDVPLGKKSSERFQVELPAATENWRIGLIVGPSGSGKSTVARRAFGTQLYTGSEWPADRAVVDCFGDLPARRIVDLLTVVGFGSPPSWVKPYQVLSNGERFRCDLAKALARGLGTGDWGLLDSQPLVPSPQPPLIVFDEFTSVVDRNVAKVCSAAIAKGIRRGNVPCRFVAVTCHYDVAEWLEPDWVLDMATCTLLRRPENESEGSVVHGPSSVATDHGQRTTDHWFHRPPIRLEIHRCRPAAWQLFKRHHYLSGSLSPAARCYLTTWNGVPVNFCATLPVITKKNHRRFTRIVTLPDYQGIGIGMRAVAAVAELHRAEGLRINVTSSHPALIRHCQRSPLWRAVNVKKCGGRSADFSPRRGGRTKVRPTYRNAAGRAVVSFEYLGTTHN